jgi:hypothetical protein
LISAARVEDVKGVSQLLEHGQDQKWIVMIGVVLILIGTGIIIISKIRSKRKKRKQE